MDYEKKYKEALERAKNLHKDAIDMREDLRAKQCEIIFPELAESEDERVRKSIIAILNNYVDNSNTFKPKMLAWLEKQGESKPTDIVEPKFHKGDWVVREYTKDIITINQVVDVKRIDDECFGYTLDDGTYFSGSWESSYHLWTIKDAKDGDVLVASDGSIFLFKDTTGYACKHYVALTTDGAVKLNEGLEHYWEISTAVHPATKEQSDLLFKKVHEAGYKWNADKKKLGKRVIDEGKSEMDYCFTKMMNGEKVSSAWTEDDERIYIGLDNLIYSTLYCDSRKEFSEWLKSIKERIQPHPKQEWSEEDEAALCDALWCCKQARTTAKDENDMGNIWYAEKWLESIKERMKGK